MNLSSLSGPLAHIPTDWIILTIIAVIIMVDAIRSGASRAIALSLALPMMYAAAILLPKTAFIGPLIAGLNGMTLGFVILCALLVLTVFVYRITKDYSSASPVQAVLACLAAIFLLAVFWIQVPALSAIWHFSAPVTHIFGTTYAVFWIIFSYLLLIAVRR